MAYAGKNFGGVHGFGRPRRGSAGRSPSDAGEFSKMCKQIFLRKLQKMHYFNLFFENILRNHALLFRAFGRKSKILGNFLINFRKFSKNLFRKFRKSIILAYFSKNLTNHALIFRAFGQKLQIVWKFWENFGNFWWKFNGKIEFLSIFGKSCC